MGKQKNTGRTMDSRAYESKWKHLRVNKIQVTRVVLSLFLGSAVNAATDLRSLAEDGNGDWIPDVCNTNVFPDV